MKLKAPCILIIYLFISYSLHAQTRFYAGIHAGPTLSFSNSTGQKNLLADNLKIKFKKNIGFIGGYNFPNKKYTLEGAYNWQFHAMGINFQVLNDVAYPPSLLMQFRGDAASLSLKTTLNNPESFVKIRSVIGLGKFWMDFQLYQQENHWLSNQDKSGFYYFPGNENMDMFAVRFKSNGNNLNGTVLNLEGRPSLFYQVGLEAEMEIFSQLHLGLSLIYQNCIRPIYFIDYEYTYNFNPVKYTNGAISGPTYHGNVNSRAEALNLNIGITYAFGKRNKTPE